MVNNRTYTLTPCCSGTAAFMNVHLGWSAKRRNTPIEGATWPLSRLGRSTE